MKAFPQKYPADPSRPWLAKENPVDTGMDLRDYFAAKAMQAMIGNNVFLSTLSKNNRSKELAEHAFEMANVMMEARND